MQVCHPIVTDSDRLGNGIGHEPGAHAGDSDRRTTTEPAVHTGKAQRGQTPGAVKVTSDSTPMLPGRPAAAAPASYGHSAASSGSSPGRGIEICTDSEAASNYCRIVVCFFASQKMVFSII